MELDNAKKNLAKSSKEIKTLEEKLKSKKDDADVTLLGDNLRKLLSEKDAMLKIKLIKENQKEKAAEFDREAAQGFSIGSQESAGGLEQEVATTEPSAIQQFAQLLKTAPSVGNGDNNTNPLSTTVITILTRVSSV
eukprot:scaffold92009_cov60-Cyclotella_meneghiniana.AAC.1